MNNLGDRIFWGAWCLSMWAIVLTLACFLGVIVHPAVGIVVGLLATVMLAAMAWDMVL